MFLMGSGTQLEILLLQLSSAISKELSKVDFLPFLRFRSRIYVLIAVRSKGESFATAAGTEVLLCTMAGDSLHQTLHTHAPSGIRERKRGRRVWGITIGGSGSNIEMLP